MVRNPDLPRPHVREMSKAALLDELRRIDGCVDSRNRVLRLESEFRARIGNHVASLPPRSSRFRKFNTSPFVLVFYARQKGYHFVSQIEGDILPAKLFSSMETSAGRMVQSVTLPVYGWEDVPSTMHSSTSVIDARRLDDDMLRLATLKSGPRCLNDEMSKDIADDIVAHAEQWAEDAGRDRIDFTYAALYGTPKQSNKKDRHILRNIVETVGTRFVITHPRNFWTCSFRVRSVRVDVTVRLGVDWWLYVGGRGTLVELLVALIRACVSPTSEQDATVEHAIADLGDIVSTSCVPTDYNVGIMQRSQLEWLFFLAQHYCDRLVD